MSSKQQVLALKAVVKGRFGLSTAEMSVALALVMGNTVENISLSRGVTPETVRSQLKAIFRKTGARSQLQLVALILRP